MEKSSFGGADFSGVKAYSDGPALKANNDLGAHAYAAGDQVAFASSNPSKALGRGSSFAARAACSRAVRCRSRRAQATGDGSDGGIDTSGEAEAERRRVGGRGGQARELRARRRRWWWRHGRRTGAQVEARSRARGRGSEVRDGPDVQPRGDGEELPVQDLGWQKKPFEVPDRGGARPELLRSRARGLPRRPRPA